MNWAGALSCGRTLCAGFFVTGCHKNFNARIYPPESIYAGCDLFFYYIMVTVWCSTG